jgi:hypothetical protein
MRFYIVSGTLLTIAALIVTSVAKSQGNQSDKPKPPTSNQLLMRDKLTQMNRILEGITLDQYDQVEDAAEILRKISRAAGWHIVDQSPQYVRLSKNFQEQAVDLERHAKERNVEAATLDLVRMNVTCTHCHQHMREEAARRK